MIKRNRIENSSFALCFQFDVCSVRSRLHDQFWSVVSEYGTELLPQNCRLHNHWTTSSPPCLSGRQQATLTSGDSERLPCKHPTHWTAVNIKLWPPIMCGDYEILVATNATAVRTFKLVHEISLTIFWIAFVYFHWEGNKEREEWGVIEGGKRG